MERHAFVRLTEFTAARKEDRDRLASLVSEGQTELSAHPDCGCCETLIEPGNPRKVVAIEHWADPKSRQAAAAAMSSELVRAAIELMSEEPSSRDLWCPRDR